MRISKIGKNPVTPFITYLNIFCFLVMSVGNPARAQVPSTKSQDHAPSNPAPKTPGQEATGKKNIDALCLETKTSTAQDFLNNFSVLEGIHPWEETMGLPLMAPSHQAVATYHTRTVQNNDKVVYQLRSTHAQTARELFAKVLGCLVDHVENNLPTNELPNPKVPTPWIETELQRFLKDEAPDKLSQDEVTLPTYSWGFKNGEKIVKRDKAATFDNIEALNRLTQLRNLLKIFTDVIRNSDPKERKAIAQFMQAFIEQLLSNEPTEAFKNIARAIGEKMKAGDAEKLNLAEQTFVGVLLSETRQMDDLWGPQLSATYKQLILSGEPKVAEAGSEKFSLDPKNKNFLFNGSPLGKTDVERVLSPPTDHAGNNLFWKDDHHPLRKTILGLEPEKKIELRKWILDRIHAIDQGQVSSHDPMAKERLIEMARLVDAKPLEMKDGKVDGGAADALGYKESLIGFSKEAELRKSPEYDYAFKKADSIASMMAKEQKMELPTDSRWNLVSKINPFELTLLETLLREADTDADKKAVIAAIKDPSNTAIIQLARSNPRLRTHLTCQLKLTIGIGVDDKVCDKRKYQIPKSEAFFKPGSDEYHKAGYVIDMIQGNKGTQTAAMVEYGDAIRNALFEKVKKFHENSAGNPANKIAAGAGALLLHLPNETGITEGMVHSLDAEEPDGTRLDHYSASHTLGAHQAEQDLRTAVQQEAVRTKRYTAIKDADGKVVEQKPFDYDLELRALIQDLYNETSLDVKSNLPIEQGVPVSTRILLAQLLLPDHAEHLAMLKRIKKIAFLRDRLTDTDVKAARQLYESLLMAPSADNIERVMGTLNETAGNYFTEIVQRERLSEDIQKRLVQNPDALLKIRQALEKKPGEVDLKTLDADALSLLAQYTLYQAKSEEEVVSKIVLPEHALSALLTPGKAGDEFRERMVGTLQDLAHDTARQVLAGEGKHDFTGKSYQDRHKMARSILGAANDNSFEETEQYLSYLNDYNTMGKKLRGQIGGFSLYDQYAPSKTDTKPLEDSLNSILDRKSRGLTGKLNTAERLFNETADKLARLKTEHRQMGKTKWDAHIKHLTETTMNPELAKEAKEANAYMSDRVAKQKEYEKEMEAKQKVYLEAKKALQTGEQEAAMERGAAFASGQAVIEQMNEKLGESINTLLNDSRDKLTKKPSDEAMNIMMKSAMAYGAASHPEAQAALRKSLIETANRLGFNGEEMAKEIEGKIRASYLASEESLKKQMLGDRIKAAGSITPEEKARLEGSLGSYMNGYIDAHKKRDHESQARMAQVVKFVDETYKTDLAQIADENEREAERQRLIQMARNQVAEAGEVMGRVKYLARAAQEAFDGGVDSPRLGNTNWASPDFMPAASQTLNQIMLGSHSAIKLTPEETLKLVNAENNKAKAEKWAESKEAAIAINKLRTLGFKYNGVEVVVDENTQLHLPSLLRDAIWKSEQAIRDAKRGLTEKQIAAITTQEELTRAGWDLSKFGNHGGPKELWDTLAAATKVVPIRIQAGGIEATSRDGKAAVEKFIEDSYFNNQAEGVELVPLNKATAASAHIDKEGNLKFELMHHGRLQASVRECFQKLDEKRDDHHLATEDYGSFGNTTKYIFTFGRETWENKRFKDTWDDYNAAIAACAAKGSIKDPKQDARAKDIAKQEREVNRKIQEGHRRAAEERWNNNARIWAEIGIQAAITVGTLGASAAIQAGVGATRAALAAETIASLANASRATRALYYAAQVNRVRGVMVTGVRAISNANRALRVAQGVQPGKSLAGAMVKNYYKHWLMGAAPGVVGLGGVYGYQYNNADKLFNEAEALYRANAFKEPERKNFKSDEEFKKAQKHWFELAEVTDRNGNFIPDSLDRMGRKMPLPSAGEIWATANEGGNFFAGMSTAGAIGHAFNLPGTMYWSLGVGSLTGNAFDVAYGKDFYGQKVTPGSALKEAGVTTASMFPGLVFMQKAKGLYGLPILRSQIGMGPYKAPLARFLTAAGIHAINRAGHEATGRLLGEHHEAPKDQTWAQWLMGRSPDQTTFEWLSQTLPGSLFDAYFMWDMSAGSHMGYVKDQLLKRSKVKPPSAPEEVGPSKTPLLGSVSPIEPPGAGTKPTSPPAGKAKPEPKPKEFDELVSIHGERMVYGALMQFTPKEFLETQDPAMKQRIAEALGHPLDLIQDAIDLEVNGKNSRLAKALDLPIENAVEQPATSTVGKAIEGVKNSWNGFMKYQADHEPITSAMPKIVDRYRKTISDAYLKAEDPELKFKLQRFVLGHPEIILETEARKFDMDYQTSYDPETGRNHVTMSDNQQIDFLTLYAMALQHKAVKGLNYGDSVPPINMVGGPKDLYAAGFAMYVAGRVQSGRVKERDISTLLENYQDAWKRGEFDAVGAVQRVRIATTPKAANGP